MSDDWWNPENLVKSELKYRASSDINVKNDFGSYKLMLETGDLDKSLIRSHNEIFSKYRACGVKYLTGFTEPSNILDVGCGLGFTTNSLKAVFPGASVTGIDISVDAVAYATKTFKDCKFVSGAINPDFRILDSYFDLICAIEFYPFSRTVDLGVHITYLKFLIDHLSANGKLVIWQKWNNNISLSINFDTIVVSLKEYNFECYEVPLAKIYRIFPSNYKFSLIFSKIIKYLLKMIGCRDFGDTRCVVISRNV